MSDDAPSAATAGRWPSCSSGTAGGWSTWCGCVGFLLHGNMLVGVWKDSLIARLGPEEGDLALLEPHVKEFDITGRAMKGWVLVGPEGVEGDEQLGGWISGRRSS
jgi:hypothetical protein